jgi:hypothetical protein
MATLGEGYRALGAGMSSQYQRDRDEMKKLMKLQQRQQLMTAALAPIAQGVGQFATDLISAPFKEPAKRFMTTDYGQQIKRAKKIRRAQQLELATEAKRVSESGLDMMSLYTREAGENIDRGYAQQLGKEEYEANREFYATSREEAARKNAEKRYEAYQNASKSLSQTYTDEEYADAIAKYGSESPNAAVSAWRGTKRLLGIGKTNEELRREAFDNIVDAMDLGAFVDPKNPKLIELKRQVETGMRPFNPQQIADQISEDNKNNPLYQTAVAAKEQALKDNAFYREEFATEYADLISQSGGSIRKAQAAMRERIRSNSALDDPSVDKNQQVYAAMYIGDATISGDAIRQLEEGFYSIVTGNPYDSLTDAEIDQHKEQVDKQVKATVTNVYIEATRAAEAQLYKLSKENRTEFDAKFGDSSLAKINKEALILRNMDYLIENSLEKAPITVDTKLSFEKEISVATGRLIKTGIPDDFLLRQEDAEQAQVLKEEKVDPLPAGSGVLLTPEMLREREDREAKKASTTEAVGVDSVAGIQKLVDQGLTERAYSVGREAIRLDIKTRQFETAEEAVEHGLEMSASLGQMIGMPDLSTVNGRAAIKGSVFAQDGDTQEFSITGNSDSLLSDSSDVSYTLSLDGGQVNIDVNQVGRGVESKARIYSRNPLALEDIPNGNIKNHLTYLKKTYQENISELESIGIDDPSSRSLSGLGGRARELKMINNEILGAIDLPGIGDRGDVISFLTATPIEKPQQAESLLSAPTEEAPASVDFEAPDASTVEQVAAEVSKLFNDGKAATALLRETAIQESNMGQTSGTYDMVNDPKFGRGSFGVGQVDERNFEDTMSRLRGDKGQPRNLVKYVQRFKDELGIDLTEVEYEDLADPKLGLIFTRLHYLKNPDPVPTTVQGRSKYWKKFYNTSAGAGTPDEYLSNQESYAEIYGND